MAQDGEIVILGARENNIKNVNVAIPLYRVTCVCGVSGSGKSSLVYNVLYQEAQRRFIDSISPYARQFMDNLQRPDVDMVDCIPPVVLIRQKRAGWNPRSTVGTVTEIYDMLRLLYARCALAHSPVTGEPMVQIQRAAIPEVILSRHTGEKISVYSMVVRNRKGHYRELFSRMCKKGFTWARIDGKKVRLREDMMLERYVPHTIEILLDSFSVTENPSLRTRIEKVVALALEMGEVITVENQDGKIDYYSPSWYCPASGISIPPADPLLFAFNNPYGYCPTCKGTGILTGVDYRLIFFHEKPLAHALPSDLPSREKAISRAMKILASIHIDRETPVGMLPSWTIFAILYGMHEDYSPSGEGGLLDIPEVYRYYKNLWKDTQDVPIIEYQCYSCRGKRLRPEALYFKIKGFDIMEIAKMEIADLVSWVEELAQELNSPVAREIIPDVLRRLKLLNSLGLGYLTLDRRIDTLSGGELQNVRIVAHVGIGLRDICYILDEPTIGMHVLNTAALIDIMRTLAREGNTVVVVEHDLDVIKSADFIIEMGPGGGEQGGKVIFTGSPHQLSSADTPTAKYLNGIPISVKENSLPDSTKFLILEGARGNNLKNITVRFPLNTITCVCGVSGSGKSSLVMDTLYPALMAHLSKDNPLLFASALPYKTLKGSRHVKRVAAVDQTPIGRTPRSNVATYTGAMDVIRKLFSETQMARLLGYPPGYFSFNVPGGRCQECAGAGQIKIEMQYLPDIYIKCPSCHGKRFYPHILKVRYKGKNIYDVLEMSVDEAYEFFHNVPPLRRILKMLIDVGLGYLRLGETSSSLSGGEAQRIKLVYELAKKRPSSTVYILDEPTVGLHATDLTRLITTLRKIVERENTVVVVEHNLEFIACADYIIELGPGGGKNGGYLIAEGTPHQIIQNPNSIIGKYLGKILEKHGSSCLSS